MENARLNFSLIFWLQKQNLKIWQLLRNFNPFWCFNLQIEITQYRVVQKAAQS